MASTIQELFEFDIKIKIETNIYELESLYYAIKRLPIEVREEDEKLYYEDFLKYKLLFKTYNDIESKALKARKDKKEEINLSLILEQVLVIYDFINLQIGDSIHLVRMLEKIKKDAVKFSHLIFMKI